MSTEPESTEIVDWEEEMMRQATAVAAIERPKVGQISTRAGMLSYQQVPIPGNRMNCIVVGSIYERNYFKGKFDASNIQSPECYAFSLDGHDMAPEETIANPVHTNCTDCPNNVWGSDTGSPSKRGKLCKELRKLALVPYNDKGQYEGAELAILRIPVTSVGNWGMYVNQLSAAVKRPYYAVVTEISITPDMKTQFKINFKFIEKLERETFTPLYKIREMAEKVLTTPYDPNSAGPNVADSNKF
jgi:hypothetical protein